MNKLLFWATSVAVAASLSISYAATPSDFPRATYTLTNGATCVDCRVVQKDWGATLLKPTLKGYYDRLLRQSAAGGEHLTLEKPDKTILKVATRRLKTEEISSEQQSTQYNLSTFDGQRLKNVRKTLTDYQERYFVFITDADERVTVPFPSVEYLAETDSGKLVFNGVEIKAKVTNLIAMGNQWNAAALNLQRNMTTNAMLQQQKLQTQALMMQNWKPITAPPVLIQSSPPTSPTRINCNTFGSSTTCTGW